VKPLKLLFITGSRGEWGYIRPILRLCDRSPQFKYSICATNMHLLPSFGLSVEDIEADGFKVDYRIYMSLDGYNHTTQVKSLGICLCSLADVIANSRPDWIVLAGDRGEQLMGALAGAFCYIPVAHIQAGELSGNIDGMTRHAIGKFAHLHFASNEDAAERLVRLGEEPFRVHNVGAPQVDELAQGLYTPKAALEQAHGIDFGRPFLLVVQHPVTEEFEQAAEQIDVTMRALRQFDLPKIVILPNNDAGSLMIREGIDRHRHGEFHAFANLRREDYLGIMRLAAGMIGNSCSRLPRSNCRPSTWDGASIAACKARTSSTSPSRSRRSWRASAGRSRPSFARNCSIIATIRTATGAPPSASSTCCGRPRSPKRSWSRI